MSLKVLIYSSETGVNLLWSCYLLHNTFLPQKVCALVDIY